MLVGTVSPLVHEWHLLWCHGGIAPMLWVAPTMLQWRHSTNAAHTDIPVWRTAQPPKKPAHIGLRFDDNTSRKKQLPDEEKKERKEKTNKQNVNLSRKIKMLRT